MYDTNQLMYADSLTKLVWLEIAVIMIKWYNLYIGTSVYTVVYYLIIYDVTDYISAICKTEDKKSVLSIDYYKNDAWLAWFD